MKPRRRRRRRPGVHVTAAPELPGHAREIHRAFGDHRDGRVDDDAEGAVDDFRIVAGIDRLAREGADWNGSNQGRVAFAQERERRGVGRRPWRSRSAHRCRRSPESLRRKSSAWRDSPRRWRCGRRSASSPTTSCARRRAAHRKWMSPARRLMRIRGRKSHRR